MKTILCALFLLITFAVFGQNTNTRLGDNSGSGGAANTFIGVNSGRIASGESNTFIGYDAGWSTTSGGANIFVGHATGYNTTTGARNTFVGMFSGGTNVTGSNNVFLGYHVGFYETGSDKLYIDNSDTTAPLIYGDFSTDKVTINGTLNSTGLVTIGTSSTAITTGYKLAVGGKAIAEEMVVKLQANWPDYVFEEGYKLPSFSVLAKYIKENKHLPGVPSASEVRDNGLSLGEMNTILLKKVEELTLYLMEHDKKLQSLQKENDLLKKRLDQIEKK